MVKTTNHNDDYAVKHCKTLALREAAFPRTHSAQTMRYSLSILFDSESLQFTSSHPFQWQMQRLELGWGGGRGGRRLGGGRGGALSVKRRPQL